MEEVIKIAKRSQRLNSKVRRPKKFVYFIVNLEKFFKNHTVFLDSRPYSIILFNDLCLLLIQVKGSQKGW